MVHILTGRVDSGKTALLGRVLNSLGHLKKRCDGFLTPKVYEGEKFIGYDLLDLRRNEYCPYIRMSQREEENQVGRFYFLPAGLERAIKIIWQHQIMDYLIIDEVGPLELAGRGLWPALNQQLRRSGFRGLLVIRIGLIEPFMTMLKGLKLQQFEVTSPTIEVELKNAIQTLFQIN
ncbi:MAG: hypothetical protein N3B16_05400 [Candidatus Aminicenantes bacterium]|nr:hypothetical protein [Candidatus Aminicenantes bacterium]